MSDDEDDYLSDKFLSLPPPPPTAPKSYHDLRREASKKSALKNEAGRRKSVRQMEEEAREEGLRKSLFERAREEEEERGVQSKALGMMRRMGYRVGEALGPQQQQQQQQVGAGSESGTRESAEVSTPPPAVDSPGELEESPSLVPVVHTASAPSAFAHRKTPISISMWSGRQGLGLGKRALSPSAEAEERKSKAAKVEQEDAQHVDTYRSRARREFEERRAEGRLLSARKTCVALDEKVEKKFNILWLNPHLPAEFPPSLLEHIAEHPELALAPDDASVAEKLRWQMQRDALRASPDPESLPLNVGPGQVRSERDRLAGRSVVDAKEVEMSEGETEDAVRFLRLDAVSRLGELLGYMRTTHHYCFWCGAQYASAEELEAECPGEEEEDHD